MKPLPSKSEAATKLIQKLKEIEKSGAQEMYVMSAALGQFPTYEPEDRGWWWNIVVTAEYGNSYIYHNSHSLSKDIEDITKAFIEGKLKWERNDPI